MSLATIETVSVGTETRYYITGKTWTIKNQIGRDGLGCTWDFKKKQWYHLDEVIARSAQALVPPETANRNKRQLGLLDPYAPAEPKPNEDTRPKARPKMPEIVPAVATIPAERRHYLFPLLVELAKHRIPMYLCGPAGSFKTSTAAAVAEALNLPFDTVSVCNQTTKSDLTGFKSATGEYNDTAFRRIFAGGGVYLKDEIDNGNANTVAVLNAALSNGHMTFPDARIEKSADFVCIAAANTYGGADIQYVGRNKLDAATLDRFAFIHFGYDEAMELTLAGLPTESPKIDLAEGGTIDPVEWAQFVIATRAAVAELKLPIVISPRATLYGAKLAAAGIGRAWLERMFIWKAMDNATRAKIRANTAAPVGA